MAVVTETVSPSIEPIDEPYVRSHLKRRHTRDDSEFALFIEQARQWFEHHTNRKLITATFTLKLDGFPDIILLPRGEAQEVSSVVYLDASGDSQTLTSGTDYQEDLSSIPGRIAPEPSTTWPSTEASRLFPVTVTYTAGFGSAATDVPMDIRKTLANLVGLLDGSRSGYMLPMDVSEIPVAGIAQVVDHYCVDPLGALLTEQ